MFYKLSYHIKKHMHSYKQKDFIAHTTRLPNAIKQTFARESILLSILFIWTSSSSVKVNNIGCNLPFCKIQETTYEPMKNQSCKGVNDYFKTWKMQSKNIPSMCKIDL